MPWSVRAVPLPDGDRPADLWIDATGCVSTGPVARNRAETLDELTAWAARRSSGEASSVRGSCGAEGHVGPCCRV